MRILLSAFACEPRLGSEEGVGWGCAWSLAQDHEVHVLTTPRHRAAIELYLQSHPRPKLTFSYFDIPSSILRLVVTSFLWQFYYYVWQRRISTWARGVADTFQPDVVHHVTYARYWAPSSLWKLGRPFVWGPVGGADNCPSAFLSELTLREQLEERVRPIVQAIAHCDPHLRATAQHARISLASTPATARMLRRLGGPNVQPFLQNGLSRAEIAEFQAMRRAPPPKPVFCVIGKLCGWKGQFLAVKAFALSQMPESRLVIIGSGPGLGALKRLARRCGVESSVIFTGKIPRQKALEQLADSTALLHPSLHDQSPTVVLEAMAIGRPVIALDLAGPAIQLAHGGGYLVKADDPAQCVKALAAALRTVAADPTGCARLGEKGRRWVTEQFMWETLAQNFRGVYAEAIAIHTQETTPETAVAPSPTTAMVKTAFPLTNGATSLRNQP